MPVISGSAQDGQLLQSSPGVWKGTPPFSYEYEWESCLKSRCTTIPGASQPTYRATTSEIGEKLRSIVTARNATGVASSRSAATAKVSAGPPVNLTAPAITGEPIVGQQLTAGTGDWAGTPPFSYSYEWQSCSELTGECSEIAGATEPTYTVGPLEVADGFRVLVKASNTEGSATATSAETGIVGAVLPSNRSSPPSPGCSSRAAC